MCNVCNSGGNCCGLTNNGCGCCGLFGNCQRLCRDCNGNIRVLNNGCGCNSCGCNRCRCCNENRCCHNNCGCCNDNNGCDNITVFGNNVRVTGFGNDTSTFDDYYARQYALNRRNNRSDCDCRRDEGRNNRCGDRCGCGCW